MDRSKERFQCPFDGCTASFKHMSSRSRHKHICTFRPGASSPEHDAVISAVDPHPPKQRTFGQEDTSCFTESELTAWSKSGNLFDTLQEVVQRLYFDESRPYNMTAVGYLPGSNLALVWEELCERWHPCSIMWLAGDMNRRVAGLLFDHMHQSCHKYTLKERNRMEHFFLNATSWMLEGERYRTIETIRQYTGIVLRCHSHGLAARSMYEQLQGADIGVHQEPPHTITGKRGWRWVASGVRQQRQLANGDVH